MPVSVINTLYNMKMFLALKKKRDRERKSKSVTTFGTLLARYTAFEFYNDILHFSHP